MKTIMLSTENKHLLKKDTKVVSIYGCDCGCELKADKTYTLKEIRENNVLGNTLYFLTGNGIDEKTDFSSYLLSGIRFRLYNKPEQLEFYF